MNARALLVVVAIAAVGCGGSDDVGALATTAPGTTTTTAGAGGATTTATGAGGASTTGAGGAPTTTTGAGGADAVDASTPMQPRACPVSGPGAVVGDVCFVVTPAESGLPAGGTNADVDQYALRPTAGGKQQLLVFLNGSGGAPKGGIATPASSFFSVARDAGLHVFAVSYRSDDSVGSLCKGADACFEPTRESILKGEALPGAAKGLAGLTKDEGVYARLATALAWLSHADPGGAWGDFVDEAKLATPEDAIKWDRVLASGHSQGGGHAALLGKRHALARVVALASPCDMTANGAASWLVNDGSYATDPATRFVGLGAPGDTTCDGYPAAWKALGMPAAAQHADAIVCGGKSAHAAPIKCAENAPSWAKLLE